MVLAAGSSRRFGSPKQLFVWQGETLVRRATRLALAAGYQPVLVVVGAEATAIRAELADLPVDLIDNPSFAEGQASSIRAGLAALPNACQAVLFLPCDMPYLRVETLRRLAETWRRDEPALVVPRYGIPPAPSWRGAPVIVARRLFAEWASLSGDQGGRALWARHEHELREVPGLDAREAHDVDSPADLW